MIGIYKITNLINNKIYIGKSINIEKRFTEHKKLLKNNKHFNIHLQNAYNKYGENSLTYNVIEECEINELNTKEIYWISYYNNLNNKLLYNIRSGGEGGMTGLHHSKETINKIVESRKGYKPSIETIKKLSESHKGIPSWNKGKKGIYHHTEEWKKLSSILHTGHITTQETKDKISKANKGHTFSAETKNKISKSLKEYYKTHKVYNYGTKASIETIEKLKLSHLGHVSPNKGKVAVVKNGICKMINKDELKTYLSQGWQKGNNRKCVNV